MIAVMFGVSPASPRPIRLNPRVGDFRPSSSMRAPTTRIVFGAWRASSTLW